MSDEEEGLCVGPLDIQQTALHVAFHVALERRNVEDVRNILKDYALMMREIASYQRYAFAKAREWDRVVRGLLDPNLPLQIFDNAKEHIEAGRKQAQSTVESKSPPDGTGKQANRNRA
mgnify:CR=1 FL=1